MATTPRWALEYFGGDVEGSLVDKGGKFTHGDRLVLDRLLAAFEAHGHGGGSRLADPSAAPTLTLDPGTGVLDAETTYYYVVTYIDQFGLETAAGTEASVTTPAAVDPPQGPGLNTEAGGTLADGLYMYALTAHKGAGETVLSTIATITVSDLNTVRVGIPGGMPTGADNISIWRQGPTETWFTRVQTQASAADWLDDGSVPADPTACEPANQPPSENTTESANSVVIDAPVGDLTQPTLAKAWRIYRTETSGSYDPMSLVAEVSDTTTDFGSQLVETFTDDGTLDLGWGSPPLTSRTLIPSTELAGGAGGGGGGKLLSDSTGALWRVVASRYGQLITRAVPGLPGVDGSLLADPGFSMVDINGTQWRVTVSTQGQLSTEIGSTAGEAEHVYGRGPDIPTFDGSVQYRLTISTTGILTTLGSYNGTAVEGVGIKRLFVQPTPPENPEDGDVWLDITGLV